METSVKDEKERCPVCGSSYTFTSSDKCYQCGVTKTDAKKPSVRLLGRLGMEDDKDEKKLIINTFPVPTEKEDLLDLIMAIHAQAFNIKEGLGKDNMFYLKYSECIEKAKVFHKDDPELSYYVKEFQKKIR